MSRALREKAEEKYLKSGMPIFYSELRRGQYTKEHYNSKRVHKTAQRWFDEKSALLLNLYIRREAIAPIVRNSFSWNRIGQLADILTFLIERRLHRVFVCSSCGHITRPIFPLIRQAILPRICPKCCSPMFQNYYRIFKESQIEMI